MPIKVQNSAKGQPGRQASFKTSNVGLAVLTSQHRKKITCQSSFCYNFSFAANEVNVVLYHHES